MAMRASLSTSPFIRLVIAKHGIFLRMGLSNRVATSLGKIPSLLSRDFRSQAMASGVDSPFRRIPRGIVGFPAPVSASRARLSLSHHPVLGISFDAEASSISPCLIVPFADPPPNQHRCRRPFRYCFTMSTPGHHGSRPSVVPISKVPPLCTSAPGRQVIVPPSGIVDVDDEFCGNGQASDVFCVAVIYY
jgi:hypothetical protein